MAEVGVEGEASRSFRQKVADFLLEWLDPTLTILLALTAFATAVLSLSGYWKWLAAGVKLALAASLAVVKHKSSDRISQIRATYGVQMEKLEGGIETATRERDDNAQELNLYHTQIKVALERYLRSLFKEIGCGHQDRITMFMMGEDDSDLLLLARHSDNPLYASRQPRPYPNDGAIYFAFEQARYVSPYFSNP